MYEFDTARAVRLSIRIPAGTIRVTAAEVTVSTVDVVALDPTDDRAVELAARTRVELSGSTLLIDCPERGGFLRRSPRLAVDVTVPTDSGLNVRTAAADLLTRGPLGEVTVHSASGDVEIDESSCKVVVRSASGDVRVGRVAGAFEAQTASGDLEVGEVGGTIDLHNASGDTKIGAARASTRVKSASGEVRIGSTHTGEVSVQTASGDIEVGVAHGMSLFLDLSTLSGDARSDLPTSEVTPAGSPQLALRLRSMSGDVIVRRAMAAAS